MVVIEGAFIAKMNAQKLASTLAAWLQTGQDGYFELTYTSEDRRTERTILIRPVDGAEISNLTNRAQHIECETPNGESIGLLLPRPEARQSHDVIVLTAPEA